MFLAVCLAPLRYLESFVKRDNVKWILLLLTERSSDREPHPWSFRMALASLEQCGGTFIVEKRKNDKTQERENKTTVSRREIAPIANTPNLFSVLFSTWGWKMSPRCDMRCRCEQERAFMDVKGHCGEMKEAIKIKRSQNIWAIIVCGSV